MTPIAAMVAAATAAFALVGVAASGLIGAASAASDHVNHDQILYSDTVFNTGKIFVVNADGSARHMVSARRNQAGDPDWSPDGRQIVFTAEQNGHSKPGLDLVDANGRHQRQIVGGWARREATWSPGGSSIAYVARVTLTQDDIHVVTPDGTGDRNLTRSRGDDHQPVWSRDGRRIAFVRWLGKGRPADVFVMRADGTRVNRLTRGMNPVDLSWSSDGRWLLFVGGERRGYSEGNGDIYAIRPDGSGLHNVTQSPAYYARPTLGPRGSTILFAMRKRPFEGSLYHIYTVRLDGTRLTALTSGASESEPSWSPDGRRIAYAGWNGTVGYLGVMNADGTVQRQVIRSRSVSWPIWSPAT